MFATLVAHSPDVMFRLDRELQFIYINPAITCLTGIAPDVFHGETGEEAGMRDAIWTPLAAKCLEAFASGLITHVELRDTTAYGELRLDARLIPEFDDARRVQTLLGIITDVTTRWRAQSALHESEADFRRVADFASGIIWIADADGKMQFLNACFYEATGLPVSMPLQDAWESSIHPDDAERLEAKWRDHRNTSLPSTQEFRQLATGGGYRWQRGSARATHDANGQVLRWIGAVVDIDDLKRRTDALHANEQMLALATNAAGLGIYDHDLRSGPMHWDERAAAIWGIDRTRPMTREVFMACVHPRDRESMDLPVAMALNSEGGGQFYLEYRVVTAPGEATRWASSRGHEFFVNGIAVRVIGAVQDITECKRAQERVLLEKDELLSLAETAGGTGSFELVVQSDTMRLSPRLMELYGLQTFDGSRESWVRLIHPQDRQLLPLRVARVLARRTASAVHEFRMVRPDGRTLWVEMHYRVYYDSEGRPLRVIGQNADISAHKQIEFGLRDANEALRRISLNQARLLEEERSRIARDLHDGVGQLLYLAGIRLTAALNLAVGKSLRGTLEEVFGVIGKATRDIRSMEFDLSPPQLRQFGLLPALIWLAGEMDRQFGLAVTIEDDKLEKPLDTFMSAVLYRAVREALINVAKHAKVDNARVQARRAGDFVEITVSDSGVGLRVRDAFTQGRGLGLRSLREVLIPCGGDFTYKSHRAPWAVSCVRSLTCVAEC